MQQQQQQFLERYVAQGHHTNSQTVILLNQNHLPCKFRFGPNPLSVQHPKKEDFKNSLQTFYEVMRSKLQLPESELLMLLKILEIDHQGMFMRIFKSELYEPHLSKLQQISRLLQLLRPQLTGKQKTDIHKLLRLQLSPTEQLQLHLLLALPLHVSQLQPQAPKPKLSFHQEQTLQYLAYHAKEKIADLLETEKKYLVPRTFLDHHPSVIRQKRYRFFNMLYYIAQSIWFDHDDDVLVLSSFAIVDYYLMKQKKPQDFDRVAQLVLTAIYMFFKFNEVKTFSLDEYIDSLIKRQSKLEKRGLSRDMIKQLTKSMIIQTESEICAALEYEHVPSSILECLCFFLKLLKHYTQSYHSYCQAFPIKRYFKQMKRSAVQFCTMVVLLKPYLNDEDATKMSKETKLDKNDGRRVMNYKCQIRSEKRLDRCMLPPIQYYSIQSGGQRSPDSFIEDAKKTENGNMPSQIAAAAIIFALQKTTNSENKCFINKVDIVWHKIIMDYLGYDFEQLEMLKNKILKECQMFKVKVKNF